MLVFFAAVCFVLALVFVMGASDVYILEGKKKARRELVKAAVFAVIGVIFVILALH